MDSTFLKVKAYEELCYQSRKANINECVCIYSAHVSAKFANFTVTELILVNCACDPS